MIVTLPIPGFVSVVGFAVLGFAGDGVKSAPGLSLSQVHLALCPVAVPGRCGVRQSGLASCRPLHCAQVASSATGGAPFAYPRHVFSGLRPSPSSSPYRPRPYKKPHPNGWGFLYGGARLVISEQRAASTSARETVWVPPLKL